ncbi:MAG: filamentous hemeagglutinin outer membrane protein, partial [Parcubacteria group bacterium Athens0714_26]
MFDLIKIKFIITAGIVFVFIFISNFASAATIEQLDKSTSLVCPINNYDGCSASQYYQDLGTGLSGKIKSITVNASVDTTSADFLVYLYDVTANNIYSGQYLYLREITPFIQKDYVFELNPQPVLDPTHRYQIGVSFGSWSGSGLKIFGSNNSNSYPGGEWYSDANVKDAYFILDFIEGQVLPVVPFSQAFTANIINFAGTYDNADNFNKIQFFITDVSSGSVFLREFDIPIDVAFDVPYSFNITLPKGNYQYYVALYNSVAGVLSETSRIFNFQVVEAPPSALIYQLYKDSELTCPLNSYLHNCQQVGLYRQSLGANLSGTVQSITVNARINLESSGVSNFSVYLLDESENKYYSTDYWIAPLPTEFGYSQRDYTFELKEPATLETGHSYSLVVNFGSWYGGGLTLFGSNNPDSYQPGNFNGGSGEKVQDIYFILHSVNQPPTISSLGQYKSDGVIIIAENSVTTESTVVFKAILNDSDNDNVKLQVELKEYGQSFDEIDLIESDFVSSGSETIITRYGLIPVSYHWRARAMDEKGVASDWQEFGTAGNVDFEVNIPLSYKAADLAKELVNQPYLWGGKGWDYNQDLFVSSDVIKTGYNYYNPNIKSVDTGIGVDCSGLIMWAYNRGFDSTKSRFNNFVKAEGVDGQYRYNTATTTESQFQPGDVMFFDFTLADGPNYIDHVAMYVGESGGYDVVSATSRDRGIEVRSKDSLKNLTGFRGFKQVVSALPPAVLVSAHSPVDLIVT